MVIFHSYVSHYQRVGPQGHCFRASARLAKAPLPNAESEPVAAHSERPALEVSRYLDC